LNMKKKKTLDVHIREKKEHTKKSPQNKRSARHHWYGRERRKGGTLRPVVEKNTM